MSLASPKVVIPLLPVGCLGRRQLPLSHWQCFVHPAFTTVIYRNSWISTNQSENEAILGCKGLQGSSVKCQTGKGVWWDIRRGSGSGRHWWWHHSTCTSAKKKMNLVDLCMEVIKGPKNILQVYGLPSPRSTSIPQWSPLEWAADGEGDLLYHILFLSVRICCFFSQITEEWNNNSKLTHQSRMNFPWPIVQLAHCFPNDCFLVSRLGIL